MLVVGECVKSRQKTACKWTRWVASSGLATTYGKMAGEIVLAQMAISLQPPTFWASRPATWFSHVEAQFALRHIHFQDTQANVVIVSLPETTLDDISDALPDTSLKLYGCLKTALIQRVAPKDQQ